jgi:L-iditol 2-dehydrogenase
MKAAFVRKAGGVEICDVPLPQLEDDSIIVQMKASGICGTDLEKLTGKNITAPILGHEVSGVVTESNNERFPVGSTVVPHHHVSCGKCTYCRRGAGTMCQSFRNSNFVPGGFADEFLVPKYNVENGGVHLFDSGRLSFEEACVAEPLACCIRGVEHVFGKQAFARMSALRNVLVVGAGPIGLLHMELVRSASPDARIVAVDLIQSRLDCAEKFERALPLNPSIVEGGLFSAKALSLAEGGEYDLVIVATGSLPAFSESARCAGRSGTILLFGAPHKGSMYSLDLSDVFLRELTITSSYSATDEELIKAIEILESLKIKVDKFITSRYPLEKIEEAMNSARAERQVKVVIVG